MTGKEPTPLGVWLRKERERRKWTRRELARRMIKAAENRGDLTTPEVDVLSHSMYRWERGDSAPSDRYKFAYCDVFNIEPDLFGVEQVDTAFNPIILKGYLEVSITSNDNGAQISISRLGL